MVCFCGSYCYELGYKDKLDIVFFYREFLVTWGVRFVNNYCVEYYDYCYFSDMYEVCGNV